MAYLNNNPTPIETRPTVETWDAVAEKYLIEIDNSDRELSDDLIRLFKAHGIVPGMRVLELGSGSGHLSACLAEAGYKVALLDFSEVALEKSKETFAHYGLVGTFINGDIFNLSQITESYDLVWNSGVMEHFSADDFVKILRSIRSISSSPNFLFLIPNINSRAYLMWRYNHHSNGTWEFNREYIHRDYAALCEQAGFSISSISYCCRNISDFMFNSTFSDASNSDLYADMMDSGLFSDDEQYLAAYMLTSSKSEKNNNSQTKESTTNISTDYLYETNLELHAELFGAKKRANSAELRVAEMAAEIENIKAENILNLEKEKVTHNEELTVKLARQKSDFEKDLVEKLTQQKSDFEKDLVEKLAQQKSDFEKDLVEKLAQQKSDSEKEFAEKLTRQKSDFEKELAEKLTRQKANAIAELQYFDSVASNELQSRLVALKNAEASIDNVLSICTRLLNSRSIKFIHFLSRFKYQRRNANANERRAFWKWLRDKIAHRMPITDHRYHPLFQIINPLEECQETLSSFISVAESGAKIKNIDKNGIEADSSTSVPIVSSQYMCASIDDTYKKYDVIVFSVIDYDFRYQRPQQIADHFAREGHRVFYINANFSKDKDVSIKQKNNLYLVTLPNTIHNAIYSTDFSDDGINIRNVLDELIIRNGIRDALMIADYPTWVAGIDYLKTKYGFVLTTDYMDDYTGFKDTTNLFLEKACIQLLKTSDVVVASSQFLTDSASKYNSNVLTVRNGTEFDHFNKAFGKQSNKRVIGYYGAIAHWFDYKKIQYLSHRFPEAKIVLIGAVTDWDNELKKLPNVQLLGEKPYKELPDYLAQFDVCLIPFDASTSLIQATNPVKFYEYLSAGKKVVATEIPELEPYKDRYVYLANDDKQFGDYVDLCLNNNDTLASPEECALFAKQNDWSKRVQQFNDSAEIGFPKVSIVVLCYNQLDYTKQCISSILDKTAYPNYELILVDNNSSDDTAQYLKDLDQEYDRIKIVLNTTNRGFAGGNNDGIAVASGDYILLLNNDTLVTRGWLTNMVKRFRNKNVGVVGPVTNSIGNEAMVNLGYHKDVSQMPSLAYAYTAEHMNENYPNNGTLAMFCFMFSRKVLETVGLLDEGYGIGMFEDDDYCMAVKKAGMEIVLAEDVFIHHYGSVSFKKMEDKSYRDLFEKNKTRFEEKWHCRWKMHQYRPNVKPEE